ncbi:MAG: hypothetical protein IKB52_02550 [Kiritimatiellae bacterium]|nr:hypothetical protein [Kiritimatiellia bacterium]
MGTRYHVKSATLTFGSTTYEMASGPAAKGQTKEAVDVTALSDSVKQFIPGALVEDDEVSVSLYDKGTGMPTVGTAPAALTISVTLSNGVDADVSATVSYNKAIVTKVAPPSQDGSGDRKATVDVTFRPDGSAASGGNT